MYIFFKGFVQWYALSILNPEQINQTYSLYIISIVNNTFVHINVMVSENMNTLLVLLTKMLLSETACLYCSY